MPRPTLEEIFGKKPGGMPQQQQPKSWWENAISGAQQGIGHMYNNAPIGPGGSTPKQTVDNVTGMVNSTVKPIATFAAMTGGAGLTQSPATQRAAEFGAALGQGRGYSDASKQLAKPYEMPWVGNVNPFQAGQNGETDWGKTGINVAAKSIDAGVAAYNLANPAMSGWKDAFGRGFLQGGSQSAQKPGATPQSVGSDALFSGAFSTAFAKAPDALNWLRDKRAALQGFTDEAQTLLKNPANSQTFQGFMQTGKKAMQNSNNIRPMEEVGKKVQGAYENTFLPQVQQSGKRLNQVLQSFDDSGGKINIGQAKTGIMQTLDDLNIKYGGKPGAYKLDFSNSDFQLNKGAQRDIINAVNNLLGKNKYTSQQLASKIRSLDDLLNPSMTNTSFVGDAASVPLTSARGQMSQALKTQVPGAPQAYDEFAGLAKTREFFDKGLANQNKSYASFLQKQFSRNRGSNSLENWQKFNDVTGTNYTDEAKLAGIAEGSLGLDKNSKLVDAKGLSKEGAINWLLEKITRPPASAAQGLIKQAQGLGITGLPQGMASKFNALPLEVSKYLSNMMNPQANVAPTQRKSLEEIFGQPSGNFQQPGMGDPSMQYGMPQQQNPFMQSIPGMQQQGGYGMPQQQNPFMQQGMQPGFPQQQNPYMQQPDMGYPQQMPQYQQQFQDPYQQYNPGMQNPYMQDPYQQQYMPQQPQSYEDIVNKWMNKMDLPQ